MEAAKKIDINKRYTYADYCTWNDDERWELIDGVPYPLHVPHAMAPAPSWGHQGISGELYEKYGVKEYWILDLKNSLLVVNILEDGKYVTKSYGKEDTAVPIEILKGCTIDLTEVFKET